jgi:hypothetical protein
MSEEKVSVFIDNDDINLHVLKRMQLKMLPMYKAAEEAGLYTPRMTLPKEIVCDAQGRPYMKAIKLFLSIVDEGYIDDALLERLSSVSTLPFQNVYWVAYFDLRDCILRLPYADIVCILRLAAYMLYDTLVKVIVKFCLCEIVRTVDCFRFYCSTGVYRIAYGRGLSYMDCVFAIYFITQDPALSHFMQDCTTTNVLFEGIQLQISLKKKKALQQLYKDSADVDGFVKMAKEKWSSWYEEYHKKVKPMRVRSIIV